jgi:hypothetical protein
VPVQLLLLRKSQIENTDKLLAWWQEDLTYSLYVAASVLLLLDIDIVSWLLPPSAV